jgi:hypothetical protein
MSTEAIMERTAARPRHASSTAWFWWKESRQLAPLVGLLVIVAAAIFLLNSFAASLISGFVSDIPSELMLLVFPGLFATGAGPLLVGQERALRTLDWLVLLPIRSRRLVVTKFLVALAGLALMWLFAGLMIAAFGLARPDTSGWEIGGMTSSPWSALSYPVWISHSFFVLACGFFVAWRIKNQFYSMIALVPLAFAPMLLTQLISASSYRAMQPSTFDWMNFGIIWIGIVIVMPLMLRAAMRTLGASPAPNVRPVVDLPLRSPAGDAHDSIPPRFATRIAPVLWQSLRSAQGTWCLLNILLAAGMLAVVWFTTASRLPPVDFVAALCLIAIPFVVSWMGVAVFKHDGGSLAVRFLSDRGVSPWRTWWSLHAVPTAMLCGWMTVYGLWCVWVMGSPGPSDAVPILPTLPIVFLILGAIYIVSQWVSQFVRTLILAVILAPILAGIVIGWAYFCYVSLAVPLWMVVCCLLVPLVATACMMRRYMDGTDRPLTFGWIGIAVGVFVLVPFLWSMAYVRSIPGMDSAQRETLLAEARSNQQLSRTPMVLSLGGVFGSVQYNDPQWSEMDPIDEVTEWIDNYQLDPSVIIEGQKLESTPGKASNASLISATVGFYEFRTWYGGFYRAQVAWHQDGDEASFEQYGSWLHASADLLPVLRRSLSLETQEVADRLEVMLIDAVLRPELQAKRDHAAVRAAIDAIGTPDQRAVARRRAVLNHWLQTTQEGFQRQYRFRDEALRQYPMGLIPLIEPSWNEARILAMLDGVEAAREPSSSNAWRRRLFELTSNRMPFSSSRYGDWIRDQPAIQTMSVLHLEGFGHLWGRDWEYVDVKQ